MSVLRDALRIAALAAALGLGACQSSIQPPAVQARAAVASTLRPMSYLALRFEATVPQRLDYTCGAASVATILTYYWGRPTTEAEAMQALRQRYTAEELNKRREAGLSFDDLIFVAERLGFSAEGAKVPTAELAKLDGPVIVHLDKSTFQHFVVLRRVGDGVFYLSDPIVGQVAMAAAEFGAQYSGNALAIWKKGADLPRGAKLLKPRDGTSVDNAIGRTINAPFNPAYPIL